jgi:hypothetical protein
MCLRPSALSVRFRLTERVEANFLARLPVPESVSSARACSRFEIWASIVDKRSFRLMRDSVSEWRVHLDTLPERSRMQPRPGWSNRFTTTYGNAGKQAAGMGIRCWLRYANMFPLLS